jgi:Uma2 family endonuclease
LVGLNRGLVLSDMIVDWGVEEVRSHSPDVSVFEDVDTPPVRQQGTFHLAEAGGRCVLVIELVSPHTRDNDVERKRAEYHQVGVPLYILVDQERLDGPRKILAYEYHPEGYVPVPLDARGRLLVGPLGLCLGLKDGWVVCYETVSGEEVEDYEELTHARKEEAARRRAAEERSEREAAARQAAEVARHAAEEQSRQDAEARRAAEELVRQETAARQAADAACQSAEAARQAAEAARKAAEEQARRETEARLQMQQRLRELEAELRQRGEPSP